MHIKRYCSKGAQVFLLKRSKNCSSIAVKIVWFGVFCFLFFVTKETFLTIFKTTQLPGSGTQGQIQPFHFGWGSERESLSLSLTYEMRWATWKETQSPFSMIPRGLPHIHSSGNSPGPSFVQGGNPPSDNQPKLPTAQKLPVFLTLFTSTKVPTQSWTSETKCERRKKGLLMILLTQERAISCLFVIFLHLQKVILIDWMWPDCMSPVAVTKTASFDQNLDPAPLSPLLD